MYSKQRPPQHPEVQTGVTSLVFNSTESILKRETPLRIEPEQQIGSIASTAEESH